MDSSSSLSRPQQLSPCFRCYCAEVSSLKILQKGIAGISASVTPLQCSQGRDGCEPRGAQEMRAVSGFGNSPKTIHISFVTNRAQDKEVHRQTLLLQIEAQSYHDY